jgi:predicted TIM-barrel fold metal-dependent hydrolase
MSLFSTEDGLLHCGRPRRREFLGMLAAFGASALIPGHTFGEQTDGNAAAGKWVDVHHHFSPPVYAEFSAQKKVLPRPMVGWSPEKTLDDMDKAGVATAFNSIVTPGVWFGDPEQARHLARTSNEYAAKLISDHPGRFGSFATVTLPDIDGSLKELEYALDVLKADGIMLFTSYGDKWLGDPFFAPLFEELDRRGTVVFVHPTSNQCCVGLLPGVSAAEIEYGTDTTRAIVRMVLSGSAKRYSKVRMIFSHGGGTMPYLIGRFVNRVARGGDDTREQHDFQAEVGRFYYDTAQTFHPVPMTALKRVVPVSQILFGTDYPYRSSLENTNGLTASQAFTPDELELVRRGNAVRLLPRLQKAETHAS